MSEDFRAIAQEGAQRLRAGDHAGAVAAFAKLAAAGKADAAVYSALAMAHRGLGAAGPAREAVAAALALEPANIRALILHGDDLAAGGDMRAATGVYMTALKHAARLERAPADLAAELARVQHQCTDYAAAAEAFVRDQLQRAGPAGSGRVGQALDILFGRRQVYHQAPRRFYFPGLPLAEFYEPAQFAWAAGVEAAFGAIRQELAQIAGREEAFVPYLEQPSGPGRIDRSGLAGSRSWTAHFLVKDGVAAGPEAARFPATMAALAGAPLTAIPGRTPSVLFSRLKPGAHIPPHSGMTNARLVCHLPLIVPAGCRLRVGGETRAWREGKLLIFDDSIEHEAWNESAEERIVLIFDIWRPEITAPERAGIAALFEAIAAHGLNAGNDWAE